MTIPAGTKLGKYRILSLLGRGGMGEVYLAEHQSLGGRAAVKVLSPYLASDPEMVRRFLQEGKSAYRLNHPNTIKIEDVGQDEGLNYLAMAYVDGGSLAQLLARRGALPEGEVVRISRAVLSALAKAHEQGVVHRDLKPENILLDRQGHVVVSDFGISKALWSSSQLTSTGSFLGSPRYTCPEQIQGRRVDARGDLYSWGVVMYEMAIGQHPFPAEGLLAVLFAHAHTAPAPPRQLRPELSAGLSAAILKALAKNPEERFAGAGEMLQALEGLDGATAGETGQLPGQPLAPAGGPEATLVMGRAAVGGLTRRAEARSPLRFRWLGWGLALLAALAAGGGGWLLLGGQPEQTLRNFLGMELVLIPEGSFMMGTDPADLPRVRSQPDKARGETPWEDDDRFLEMESPARSVSISPKFYLQNTAVTNEQFEAFVSQTGYRTEAEVAQAGRAEGLGGDFLLVEGKAALAMVWTGQPAGGGQHNSPWQALPGADWRHPQGPRSDIAGKGDHPVVQVTWADAMAFCQWLSLKEGRQYRLPTQAQWEYACRGGRAGQLYAWGSRAAPPQGVGNLADESFHRLHAGSPYLTGYDDRFPGLAPVASFQANGWGLYDMVGNVWQWCADVLAPSGQTASGGSPAPKTVLDGRQSLMVVRGGAWNSNARQARPGFQGALPGNVCSNVIGFRVAREYVASDNPDEESRQLRAENGLLRQQRALAELRASLSAERHRLEQRQVAGERGPAGTGPPPGLTNSLGMRLALIPAGAFNMGAGIEDLARLWANHRLNTGEPWQEEWNGALSQETPAHVVRITAAFHLQTSHVTNDQFAEFIRDSGYRSEAERQGFGWVWMAGRWQKEPGADWRHPFGKGRGLEGKGSHPVVQVSWNDALAFCQWLSAKEGARYSLPSEAQWEYACRGGRAGELYSWGAELPPRRPVANLRDQAFNRKFPGYQHLRDYDDGYAETAPVAGYEANDLGLHDMLGNVWTWCADYFGEGYYQASPAEDPAGPASGEFRVLRGGSWQSNAWLTHSAYRSWNDPGYRANDIGFRVVREP
ncbi:MAG: bifunctional serine/threonine-protein kinase/formylglycine-generating enzyme family protein [Pseudomonadota bacterium]